MSNYVITIARGYGSGGKTIGKELAEKLGIPCYDREILHLASDDSGINEDLFLKADEKVSSSLFNLKKSVYTGNLIPPEDRDFVSDENLFNYQAKIIKEKATSESCIIIGRAADYILRTEKNVVSINIQAPFSVCVAEIMNRQSLSQKDAEKKIRQIDKYRSDFYLHYTGQDWKDPTNYDLVLNSARLGWERTAEAIIKFTEFKLGITIE
ncbi:MAG: cytidylate kinase-like family protein [Lachnospiraceae bacterium]|nr:cytidylate kinase-like family protein [Lachnospiraceae bacterium]